MEIKKRLTVHGIVKEYDKAIKDKKEAEAKLVTIDAGIQSVENVIKRKQIELNILTASKMRTQDTIIKTSDIISKLKRHYGEAKAVVKKLLRLRKFVSKTEEQRSKRIKILNEFKSIK